MAQAESSSGVGRRDASSSGAPGLIWFQPARSDRIAAGNVSAITESRTPGQDAVTKLSTRLPNLSSILAASPLF